MKSKTSESFTTDMGGGEYAGFGNGNLKLHQVTTQAAFWNYKLSETIHDGLVSKRGLCVASDCVFFLSAVSNISCKDFHFLLLCTSSIVCQSSPICFLPHQFGQMEQMYRSLIHDVLPAEPTLMLRG